jgi:hypothetical protein
MRRTRSEFLHHVASKTEQTCRRKLCTRLLPRDSLQCILGFFATTAREYATQDAVMLSASFPRYAIDVCFEDVREGCVLFSNYLDGTILDVEIEFESWQLTCGALKDKPCDSLSSLDVCNALCFPNIRKLLTIFATLPVSTATAERSFSVLKLLESNSRSRMGRGTTELINIGKHIQRLF